MNRVLLFTFLLSFSLPFANASESLSAPKSKKEVKAYYAKIDEIAKKLGSGEDEKVVVQVLESCLQARSLEPNMFCLESILSYYIKNSEKVQEIAAKSLSKDDSELVIKRLDILKFETLHGNDPSVY